MGVNDWVVCPFQVHDEIAVVSPLEMVDSVAEVVHESVESYRDKIPLIGMSWKKNAPTWAEK